MNKNFFTLAIVSLFLTTSPSPISAQEKTSDEAPIDVSVGALLNKSEAGKIAKYFGTAVSYMLKGTVFESALKGIEGGIKAAEKELSKGVIPIPLIGQLKFKKFTGDYRRLEFTKAPMLVGTLYDKSGKKRKSMKVGPIQIKHFQLFIVAGEKTPILRCEITLFNRTGYFMQKEADEGYAKFKVILHKRLRVPTGVKRWAEPDEFEFYVSPEQRKLSTKLKLFGTQKEDPSELSIDFVPPFPFKVKAKKIPVTSISAGLNKTPFKNVILENVNMTITSYPPSFKLSGKANLQKINLGIKSTGVSTVIANLGAEGIVFYFKVSDVQLPLKLGSVKEMSIRVGGDYGTGETEKEEEKKEDEEEKQEEQQEETTQEGAKEEQAGTAATQEVEQEKPRATEKEKEEGAAEQKPQEKEAPAGEQGAAGAAGTSEEESKDSGAGASAAAGA